MWGNINALYAAIFIFSGGVISASIPEVAIEDPFPTNAGSGFRWINIIIGVMIFLIEYPRSARRVAKTNIERPGQSLLAPLLHNISFIGSNYIVRFLFYLVLVIPCFFVLPTIFGGMCLFFACLCYFFAALNGECWKAPSLAWGPGRTKKEEAPRVKEIPQAPSEPPPRPPPQAKYGLEVPPSSPPPRPV